MFKNILRTKVMTSDVPLEYVKSSQLIPWMMALMVYLATMSLTSTMLIHRLINNWHQTLASSKTLNISNYLNISYSFLGFALIVTGVIAFTTVMMIIFITRTGLTIHEKIIDILRLMGAERKFISHQFQAFFFKTALKGAMIGLVCSSLTYCLVYDKGIFNLLMMSGALDVKNDLWIVVLSTPLLLMFIVLLTARMTVFMALEDQ